MRVVLAGGGTGGHLYPAIALAEAIVSRGGSVVFFTGNRPIEDRVFQGLSFERIKLNVGGIATVGLLRKIAALLKTIPATMRAAAVLWRERPDFVALTGGYVAFPVGIASLLLRRPLILVEPNAIVGRVTKLLSRFATVTVSLAIKRELGSKSIFGVPVRRAIVLAARRNAGSDASLPVRILVLGGSQGAASLNREIPKLPTLSQNVKITHIAGPGRAPEVLAAYRESGHDADVIEYADDMASQYDGADFTIARAGAGTITELMACGLPAILVPYPHAADDHQTANAKIFVEAGGGESVVEGENFTSRLNAAVARMLDPEQRHACAKKLDAIALNFDAAAILAKIEAQL